jgi:hypothetical protein
MLRSIPPVIITNICPRAVIARKAPAGAIALKPALANVPGAQIEATITRRMRARNTGM